MGERFEDPGCRSWGHQRGSAAAEKYAPYFAPLREAGKRDQLANERVGKIQSIDAGVPYMRIEVAIRAFGLAERPVNVDRKIFQRVGHCCSRYS
jgi:hypothetical protein